MNYIVLIWLGNAKVLGTRTTRDTCYASQGNVATLRGMAVQMALCASMHEYCRAITDSGQNLL